MAEELIISKELNKKEQYEELIPQIQALIHGETNLTANLANISAALKQSFNWWWVGFYWVDNKELILGPFQGQIACTRIAIGKGVCGTAWKNAQTIIVPDVSLFAGHIACSTATKSEIVIPIIKDDLVVGVLDCDSELIDFFDATDQIYLEKLCNILSNTL
jgi:L-methionine (R)-S-oxide reductase